MFDAGLENLAPDRFEFWRPPAGATVSVGPEQYAVGLPDCPLPVHRGRTAEGPPADTAIGEGVYDYLRQFPDCHHGRAYAILLMDAYPHFISDLAAHAVMLDAKHVEPAYVLRKLTCLKILFLLDPSNVGLLLQLSHGYFELAFNFSELATCRHHLREAMRFGQEMLRVAPDDPRALSLLAEVDFTLGDFPAAIAKWQRLATQVVDSALLARIESRIEFCQREVVSESALVDDLEAIAEAMQLHAAGNFAQASQLLEKVEEQGRVTDVVPSADFFWLLGTCRQNCGDAGGAARAFQAALDLEPDHAASLAALDTL